LKDESRIIKQALDFEIDYRNLDGIEKAILTELAGYRKLTLNSLIEKLKNRFKIADINATLKDLESKGWVM